MPSRERILAPRRRPLKTMRCRCRLRYCATDRASASSEASVSSFLATFVLCLTGFAKLRIRPVFEQQIRTFFVVEDTAEPIAVPGRSEPRRNARLAHGVHVGALVDEPLEEGIPSA